MPAPRLQVKRRDDSVLQEEEERTVSIIANLLQVRRRVARRVFLHFLLSSPPRSAPFA